VATAGAYTSTAAIGDSIISSSSHLIIATAEVESVAQQHLLVEHNLVMQFMVRNAIKKADGSTDSTSYAMVQLVRSSSSQCFCCRWKWKYTI
jgi:hypothetical protein